MTILARDLVKELMLVTPDQPVCISVDVRSVDPILGRRVQCTELLQIAPDCEGQDLIISVAGEWNDVAPTHQHLYQPDSPGLWVYWMDGWMNRAQIHYVSVADIDARKHFGVPDGVHGPFYTTYDAECFAAELTELRGGIP